MSLSAMTDRALASDAEAPAHRPEAPALAKAVAAVAAYFPTETVGVYLAVLAMLQPSSDAARWGFYFLFLGFTVLVVLYYGWKKRQADTGDRIDRRSEAWLLLFAVVSFTIWSATTPWTPFLQFADDAQRYAGAATIVLAPLLPMAAQVLRLSPPWR